MRLDQDTIVAKIKQAKRDIEELKNRQFVGASDIEVVVNSTENLYDTVQNGDATNAFDVDFNSSKDFALADLTWTVAIDTPSNTIHPGDADYPIMTQIRLQASISGTPSDPSIRPDVTRFVVHFIGSAGHLYYIKFYCQSTAQGTITL
jgi:hypothetical protein